MWEFGNKPPINQRGCGNFMDFLFRKTQIIHSSADHVGILEPKMYVGLVGWEIIGRWFRSFHMAHFRSIVGHPSSTAGHHQLRWILWHTAPALAKCHVSSCSNFSSDMLWHVMTCLGVWKSQSLGYQNLDCFWVEIFYVSVEKSQQPAAWFVWI
jgi:hypothetical protein